MEKNNENTRNNESKFRDFNVSKVKGKQILFSKKTYDTIVAYLKILNQGTDGHDFPEKIKKEFKEISMN